MDARTGTVVIDHPEGQIEVPAEAVLRLTEPLLGFSRYLEYALVPAAREGVWWFMSVDSPTVTFVLADPFVAFPDFAVDLSEADRSALALDDPAHALALVLVTLPPGLGGPVTANLRAPIVCSVASRRARQVVASDDRSQMREAIDLAIYPLRPE